MSILFEYRNLIKFHLGKLCIKRFKDNIKVEEGYVSTWKSRGHINVSALYEGGSHFTISIERNELMVYIRVTIKIKHHLVRFEENYKDKVRDENEVKEWFDKVMNEWRWNQLLITFSSITWTSQQEVPCYVKFVLA